MKQQKVLGGDFIPKEYQVPDKKKQFLKISEGDNQFRFISAPLLGYVFFNEDKKPVRRPFSDGDFTPDELEQGKCSKNEDGTFEGSKHFWAAIVWSRKHNAPKVLEITQSSILRPLEGFCRDADWGDPRKYDINIVRKGTGKMDTEFSVVPKPHKDLESEIIQVIVQLEETCDLTALMKGEYPFKSYDFIENE